MAMERTLEWTNISKFQLGGVKRVVGRTHTLEMQSEDTPAARDPLKEACLARGVWMNS